jgi:hypothetical protein
MRKTLYASALSLLAALSMAQSTTPTTGDPVANPQATTPGAIATVPSTKLQDLSEKMSLNNEDAAATIALSTAYKKDPSMIVADKGNLNATIYQLGPAFALQQPTNKSVTDLVTMNTGGQTWLQIAQANNISASVYNPTGVDTSSWTNDDFTSGVWQGILMSNYGLSKDDMVYLTTGLHEGLNEVVVGAVVAREDNTPIRDVMSAYNQHSDWSAIEQQYALNVHTPPNQSQNTTDATAVVTTPVSPPPTQTTAAVPATQDTTTTDTTTDQTTPAQPQPQAQSSGTTTSTDNMATESALSPIEEWQIQGGDINPYNGWAEASESVTYGLSASHHHRRVRRARRHRRHHM